jgi:biotin-(acetyl-CoA carboxylase) ligase
MNDVEMLIERGAGTHGVLVLAEEQSTPQTRAPNRTWLSTSITATTTASNLDGNLSFSLLVRCALLQHLMPLVFITPIAVAAACESVGMCLNQHSTQSTLSTCIESSLSVCACVMASHSGLTPRIKWPNDVWLNERKCAGILIRSQQVPQGDGFAATVGVGINVNQNFSVSELAAQAISLRDALGSRIDRETLLAVFCNRFEALLACEQQQIMDEYKRYDMLQGRRVTIKPKLLEDHEAYEADVLGYSDDGSLIVRNVGSGETVTLTYGEVMVRPVASTL